MKNNRKIFSLLDYLTIFAVLNIKTYNKMEAKLTALAAFLGVDQDELTNSYDNYFQLGSQEYLVLTDDEADEYTDEYLENYIDECILHEIPEGLQGYFDCEGFKYDCKMDGRGHYLATYDGHENEEGEFYIYRIN